MLSMPDILHISLSSFCCVAMTTAHTLLWYGMQEVDYICVSADGLCHNYLSRHDDNQFSLFIHDYSYNPEMCCVQSKTVVLCSGWVAGLAIWCLGGAM